MPLPAVTNYNLPSAEPGLNYTFANTGILRQTNLVAGGTDKIYFQGTEFTSIKSIQGGDSIEIACLANGQWIVLVAQGTWTGTV